MGVFASTWPFSAIEHEVPSTLRAAQSPGPVACCSAVVDTCGAAMRGFGHWRAWPLTRALPTHALLHRRRRTASLRVARRHPSQGGRARGCARYARVVLTLCLIVRIPQACSRPQIWSDATPSTTRAPTSAAMSRSYLPSAPQVLGLVTTRSCPAFWQRYRGRLLDLPSQKEGGGILSPETPRAERCASSRHRGAQRHRKSDGRTKEGRREERRR